jgi:biopolymer transport protein ExbD
MLIRRKQHEIPGLNTTSTADISFMLLIFFLVTTSMDVDKGLLRQLPSPEPQKKEQQQTVVDKANLMALRLTAGDTLLVNDKPMKVSQLKEETIRFVHRLGKKHLISIESDRDADYNLYFQMQNQLMEAYSQLRNETAQKKYHRDYALLNNDQKEQVRNICPQRITESYANAMTHADQRVDANAEEKQGEENSIETATEQQKGGKQ